MSIVKYECYTQDNAFNFVEHISNWGGNACIILDENNDCTSTVITDFFFDTDEKLFDDYVCPVEPNDWDVNHFLNRIN